MPLQGFLPGISPKHGATAAKQASEAGKTDRGQNGFYFVL
jgi:hypothetical protein